MVSCSLKITLYAVLNAKCISGQVTDLTVDLSGEGNEQRCSSPKADSNLCMDSSMMLSHVHTYIWHRNTPYVNCDHNEPQVLFVPLERSQHIFYIFFLLHQTEWVEFSEFSLQYHMEFGIGGLGSPFKCKYLLCCCTQVCFLKSLISLTSLSSKICLSDIWIFLHLADLVMLSHCVMSINQTLIAPISPVKPGSVAQQLNWCSIAKSMKHFHGINGVLCVPVSKGERPWIRMSHL